MLGMVIHVRIVKVKSAVLNQVYLCLRSLELLKCGSFLKLALSRAKD